MINLVVVGIVHKSIYNVPSSLQQNFRERIEPNKLKIPKRVLQVIDEELTKLEVYKAGHDFTIARNYLDWLTVLPWGNYSGENCDVTSAEKILDEDHYGLSNVKQRIIEHVAVEKLGGTSQGKIICLAGPPGVGKTSIARSIARALHRNFFQCSVGGLSTAANIKGIPRTRHNGTPGKMVQCLKSVGTQNPVVLIDEVDKLGRHITGDTVDALLELLDPELNANFMDHYLDVPIDLSKVFFVCTTNVIDKIPTPLLNRMEVITIAGYLFADKMHIARDYLEKTARKDCGIKPEEVDVSDCALRSLIENYGKEVGVRNLQKHIEKIYRRSALKLVRDDISDTTLIETVKKVSIKESNLADYVGKPISFETKVEKIYEQIPVGVSVGLTTRGIGYIETNVIEEEKGKGGLSVITGQLGNAMRESVQVASTVARRFLLEKEPENPFFANSKLHLHVTGSSNKKNEGLSGGCTFITSLLSLAMKKPVKKDLAMTGAVNLTGRILPIGGVKMKTVAARRNQIKTIIFPALNRRDFEVLPQDLKEGLDVHFVDEYDQIFDIAFNYDDH
ncbi:PREDICTED: lon protease homolog 1, mitochondrial-like [Camelina sativa]|uniref:Lon protease homolog 1, mitochondrial-like n=1 Tax=Camelina sativa TaxID=90675 RepID=A0ABM0SY85_CAMSA|nr:PREDICTED: lon protease homolog 1, mitochondrial-like [Camelina sativa]